MATITADQMLARARERVPELRARSEEIEGARRLPQDLADGLFAEGFHDLLIPTQYGGLELDPVSYIEIVKTLAEGDASAAWCAMIGSTTGMLSAYIPEDAARAAFSEEPRGIHAGVFAPMGKAVREGDVYRATGRWQWGSGSPNAQRIWGGCVIAGPDGPERMPNGAPLSKMLMFPASEVEILDTWDVMGLCGTGSNDFAVSEIRVPVEFAANLFADPLLARPLYRIPIFAFLAVAVSSVCLGIARAAIDELVGFASQKTPQGAPRTLAQRPSSQATVARAETAIRSAETWLKEAAAAAYEGAHESERIELALRRDLRLAAVNAGQASAHAVTEVFKLGGGTSVYRRSPLQRHFRDIHVATTHILVGKPILDEAGRHFLGLIDDSPTL